MPRRPWRMQARFEPARRASPSTRGRRLALLVMALLLAAGTALPASTYGAQLWASERTDTGPTTVTVDPLQVEQGELIVRWTETRDGGPGIEERAVRTEIAPTTPTGCGAFSVAKGIVLDAPTGARQAVDGRGRLSLGAPPSSGCLLATVVLTDRAGETIVAASAPYRIAPPAPPPPEKPAVPAWSGRWNLYRASAFVTQKTFKWCVAASVQMMVNLVRKRQDRSTATQRRMITYAQRWDNGPYGEDGGTDVTGWIRALRHFGAGKYREVGATTAARALRIAATAMRQTGRPAGILVMEGRHAWVLHGFESRFDPRVNRRAVITAVRVSGPLYPLQQENGYDPRPNTRFSVKKLEKYFQPTVIGDLPGRYVVIVPTH